MTSEQQDAASIPALTELETAQILAQTRNMKAALKRLSKNQIIQLLLEQVNHSMDQQNINQVLLAELKELKGDN